MQREPRTPFVPQGRATPPKWARGKADSFRDSALSTTATPAAAATRVLTAAGVTTGFATGRTRNLNLLGNHPADGDLVLFLLHVRHADRVRCRVGFAFPAIGRDAASSHPLLGYADRVTYLSRPLLTLVSRATYGPHSLFATVRRDVIRTGNLLADHATYRVGYLPGCTSRNPDAPATSSYRRTPARVAGRNRARP